MKEKKGRQVKQDKRIAGITEKKSATRRAVEEKHLRKHQLVLRVDNGSVNIISGSAASSSYAVESSFPVIVVIITLTVQMIIPKQERHIMLSARFVDINKRYLDISFIQNFINAEMEKLHLDYMRFAFNAFFEHQDALSGCQILPCSHKVHRECAIAMI